MQNDLRQASIKTGLAPGELVHTGDHVDESIRIRLFRYNEKDWKEKEITSLNELDENIDDSMLSWLNVDGLHDVALIKEIGERYKLHPLLLEDILNTRQRPKVEDFGDYLYIVFKMLAYDEDQENIEAEQISIVVGPNYVVSFQEKEGDLFDGIRERIRTGKGRMRRMHPDYLAYSMLDTTIDHYFVLLEVLYEKIDALSQAILLKQDDRVPREIHALRQQTLTLRKTSWPVRQLLEQLQKSESPLVDESTTPYLRDAWDHTVRVTEAVDSIQDMQSNAMETYLSLTNQKTNQVMRFLTVVATIFMPLTFITSVYGMNFDHMPELHWHYGYFGIWGVVIVTGVGMYMYFRKKKWF
jgi:magnesium transporter